jgi:hypothetical protein
MCFEIGNKVAVIDDAIKGVVIEVDVAEVVVRDEDGMVYRFDAKELVRLHVEQRELSRYSDINNSMLRQKTSEPVRKKSGFVKTKNEIILEVDLHIEKLVKSTKGMDTYDILSYQLEVARRKVEYCIQKKISKIVFIHGVGEGVLKSELNYLLNRYPVKYYDASYNKYGLGATEVYVYQNSN